MVSDLPHGILSLDDFPFSPQTTIDKLLTSGLPVRASSCDYFRATSPVSVDGTDFLPEFSFLAGRPLRLILRRMAKIATSSLGVISALWRISLHEASTTLATLF